MSPMTARRTLLNVVRRRRAGAERDAPQVFWGRIGDYEAVTRSGVLLLLAPEPAHPSRRVTNAV